MRPQDEDKERDRHPSLDDSQQSTADRQSVLELTRGLARLPLDKTAAAVEVSANIAGVSLRASVEYLRAAPEAGEVLAATELRSWGELGRRLAMNDPDAAVRFFATGVHAFKGFPLSALPSVFQLCTRQTMLSADIATATFQKLPALAKQINQPDILEKICEIGADIARRSAKHSAEFLDAAPNVLTFLQRFQSKEILSQAIALTSAFAARAGGISSEAWSFLPTALAELAVNEAHRLLDATGVFLERGGGVALQVLLSGGDVLRLTPQLFEEWLRAVHTVAEQGNATLVAFVRSSPRLLRMQIYQAEGRGSVEALRRVLALTREVALVDGEAALASFRSSAAALRNVSIDQYEEWVRRGLSETRNDQRARRSFFALETRGSYEALHSADGGVSLETIEHVLKLYVEGLTGRAVEVASLGTVPQEARINDGRTIHLPSKVGEFGAVDLDFRLYKVLAAHGAGQIEFGTHEQDTTSLRAAYRALADIFDPENVDALDAFALNGYINDFSSSQPSEPWPETNSRDPLPGHIDYRTVLDLFPHRQLARQIFGTLENGRIERLLRAKYRGLVRDLDLVRGHLRKRRPRIAELPVALAPFELLFQIAVLGGAVDDAREYYRQAATELETIVNDYLSATSATVADTLMATARVYSLFQSLTQSDDEAQQVETRDEETDREDEEQLTSERMDRRAEQRPEHRDARELLNAWNDPNQDGEPDDLAGAESWMDSQTPEQALEEGEVAYNYDEWDRELTDHRIGWCRVVEKQVKSGGREFVEQTRERHRGVISSIRHQFQLMRPEDLTRVANELDGEEFDLNAVVDYVIDRRADGHQSERLYVKRFRRRRDVAVSFLLDQSSSTARTIGRHPLQPYTRPGRRIIEIEKEGLVLMSEALEAVGDVYSINGFTSEGRRNVKFYIVKDFDEQYTDEVKRRIGGITYQNNTRLGAAIRHATARLSTREARTRLLIVLSDGRPYDHDYGDARYAREDTREALRQAKAEGITPFCITIDRESEAELRDLYGEVGYTIIDDVLSLPERLPGIYRRLTT